MRSRLPQWDKADESIEQINLAMQLEPKSAVIHSAAGLVYYYARRYDEALQMCRKSLDIDAGFVPAHKTMRVINEASGNYAEATMPIQRKEILPEIRMKTNRVGQ